jgi:putrescine aminotransferase
MLAAIELVRNKATRQRLDPDGGAALKCRDHSIASGLMVRAVGNAIIMAPPLIIAPDEIDILVSRLSQALDATADAYGVTGASLNS